jgi:hypothetical protein
MAARPEKIVHTCTLTRTAGDVIDFLFHQKPGGKPELILDPRQVVKSDGSPITIQAFTISPDFKHLGVASPLATAAVRLGYRKKKFKRTFSPYSSLVATDWVRFESRNRLVSFVLKLGSDKVRNSSEIGRFET